MNRLLLSTTFIFLLCLSSQAQQENVKTPKTSPTPAVAANSILRSSPAYAEVILRKTEAEAELESMLLEFTDEYPKVVDARIEIDLLQKEIDRMSAVKAADAGRLSTALGKLMVRKVSFEVDLVALRLKYDDKHPDVINAKKKVDVFEKAIKDILRP